MRLKLTFENIDLNHFFKFLSYSFKKEPNGYYIKLIDSICKTLILV